LSVCPDIEKNLASDTRLRTVPITRVKADDQGDKIAEGMVNKYHVGMTSHLDLEYDEEARWLEAR
jgi:hypothetical protein